MLLMVGLGLFAFIVCCFTLTKDRPRDIFFSMKSVDFHSELELGSVSEELA